MAIKFSNSSVFDIFCQTWSELVISQPDLRDSHYEAAKSAIDKFIDDFAFGTIVDRESCLRKLSEYFDVAQTEGELKRKK